MSKICPYCQYEDVYNSTEFGKEQKEDFFISKCLACKYINKRYAYPYFASCVLERVWLLTKNDI